MDSHIVDCSSSLTFMTVLQLSVVRQALILFQQDLFELYFTVLHQKNWRKTNLYVQFVVCSRLFLVF